MLARLTRTPVVDTVNAPASISGLRRTKYFVGKNLRNLGIPYSKRASVQMWRERANRFATRGRLDEALDCRRKAFELAPTSEDLRGELARMWCDRGDNFAAQGRLDEALDCRRRVVELVPANEHARMELVRALLLADRRDEIDQPLSAEQWSALGNWLLSGSGVGYIRAEHAFRMALAHSSDMLDASYGLYECLARRNLLGEAALD
jgi:tetratricopeptide (TPR) repeat protein